MKRLFLIISIIISLNSFAQNEPVECISPNLQTTFHTNTLSTHPFGLFISRINNNFQYKAEKNISLSFGINSGNVWLPYVRSYEPVNQSDKDMMKDFIWHKREGFQNNHNFPTKYSEFHADAIFRQYQLKLNIPLGKMGKYQELRIGSRLVSIDPGNVPYSLLTSDQFLEWFHSNIYGGEDPFARKDYGFNHAFVRYQDINGRIMEINNGDLFLSGLDFSYHFYPYFNALEARNYYTNFSLHLGINTNKFNPSADLGLSGVIIKKFHFKKARDLNIGLSLGALRRSVLSFGEQMDLGSKEFLYNGELMIEYVKHYSRTTYFAIATTYNAQSRYFKRSEFDYQILSGDRITSHWHYAYTHLYKYLAGNSLVFTFGKGNFAYWMYLREDFAVDNAPDSQVGIGVRYTLED